MCMSMIPTEGQVAIRAYRIRQGDCFLLAFPGGDGKPGGLYYMLIDCGVHQYVGGGKQLMEAVVADIEAVTQGHLDVVVVSHPHEDHTSGFRAGASTFKRMNIGELWQSWTEDPCDPQAATWSKRRLQMEMHLLKLADSEKHAAAAKQIDMDVLSLWRGADATPVKDCLDAASVRYLQPGNVISIPGGVKVHVLGPPRDEKLLRKMESHNPNDVYVSDSSLNAVQAFLIAELGLESGLGDKTPGMAELAKPFAQHYRHSTSDPGKALSESYSKPENAWRRIDDDWRYSAAVLALCYDTILNNTSLVLSIELPTGKTLLFPGDAQIGNWLSWCEGPDTETLSLLARTVLYKVSHHGSVNGTLRPNGLEVMRSPELAALLPVDEGFARSRPSAGGNGWDMPHIDLLNALRQATGNRIIRNDQGAAEGAQWRSSPVVRELYADFVTG